MEEPSFHIAMYPWFAFGHLIPYLQLSNKLAEKGHRISFFIPRRTQSLLQHSNLRPNLITFIPISVPSFQGLPDGAETTADATVSNSKPLLATAFDQTQNDARLLLDQLKPDFVLFDFAYWMPCLTRSLGIKSVQYHIVSAPTIGRYLSHVRHYGNDDNLTDEILRQPPPGFPDPYLFHLHEAREFDMKRKLVFGSGVFLLERLLAGLSQSDAVAFRSCIELDGPILDYIQTQFEKPVLPTGPVIPDVSTSELGHKWTTWLEGLKAGSVIYCAFGSETVLPEDQFRELVLGFEQTGLPFFVAFKLPAGVETIEEAVPEGFLQRIEGRGILHNGWVPQQKILQHPSVGCFVSHCGYSSLLEALPNQCQLVLIPLVDLVNARRMSSSLKIAVEVERGEEGLFTKETVCKAIKTVMDENCETGKEVRKNRAKMREVFLNDKFESFYIDDLCKKLQDIKGQPFK